MNDTTIAIFARAPVPGRVKTRLIPVLGAEGAARVQSQLMERTIATAHEAACGDVVLWCEPSIDHPQFAQCIARHSIRSSTQCEGDLGARMHHAASSALESSGRVVIIGTDCPAFTPQHLIDACVALDKHDAVITPAEDGGYVLLGLKRTDTRLFEAVNWGSDKVLAQTRERLRQMRWGWHEMPALWDIDRPEDFARLVQSGLVPDITQICAASPHAQPEPAAP